MVRAAEAEDTKPTPPSQSPLSANPLPVTRIAPPSRWASLDLGELWRYRDLLYFFVWREFKIRYKQTILGVSWAIIQPFVTMVVFSIFFGGLLAVPSDDIPYPVFSYTGLLAWNLFAEGLNRASEVLVQQTSLITKVYFPRLLMPSAAVLARLIDFAPAFVVLLGMMLAFGITPTVNVVWLPAFLLLALATTLGAGFWLSAMNAQFRDVRYTVPFLVQLWLFLTPVVYPSSLLEQPWQTLYALNPMVGVVEGFRWALLGVATPPGLPVLVSTGAALALLLSGAFYFQHMERHFADVV